MATALDTECTVRHDLRRDSSMNLDMVATVAREHSKTERSEHSDHINHSLALDPPLPFSFVNINPKVHDNRTKSFLWQSSSLSVHRVKSSTG